MIQRLIERLRRNHRPMDTDGGTVLAEELLTDEESVISTLRNHSGVTWQRHIVAETDWSESKVSRVLCRMEDDGVVRRYRVGRQNLVSLPGREPDYLQQEHDPISN